MESGKDSGGVVDIVKATLPPTVVHDTPTLTTTFILTATQIPSSSFNGEVITPTITTPIDLLAQDNITTTEVWHFSPNSEQWSMSYSVTKAIEKPDNIAIPSQEIKRLKNYLETQSRPVSVPGDSLFKLYPGYLALSPTVKQLAFVESYLFFVDEKIQEAHFGVENVGTLDLETGQSQVFFQAPVQELINGEYYYTTLEMPLWSPNGQYFSVAYYTIDQNATPIIINVNKKTVQQLESSADLYGPLAWSPDSTTVVLYLYRSHFETSGGVIRLCKIDPLNCKDIELNGVWVEPLGMDWTPHRNQIVFSGSNEDFRWSPSPSPFGLYLFDPKTNAIHQVLDNFNSTLRKPRWSPDGRFIAAEYNKEGIAASPNTVAIVDMDSEQLITKLPIEGCDWQWEQSSQAIILLCGKYGLKVLSVIDASSQLIELPDNLRGKRRLGFNTLKLP